MHLSHLLHNLSLNPKPSITMQAFSISARPRKKAVVGRGECRGDFASRSKSSHLCCSGSIPSHEVDTKAGEFCCLAAPRLRFRFQVSVPGNFEVNRPATVYGDNRIHSFGVQV